MNTPAGQAESVSAANATAALKVGMLDDRRIAQWNEYVTNNRDATFFHRAEWKTVLETAFGHKCYFFIAERGGVIEGVYPLGQIKSLLFGNTLIALPFCVYGGIVADSPEAFAALDKAGVELAQTLGVGCLEYRSIHAHHDDWIGKDLYVTFRKEIFASEEDNMKAIPRKQRAMVRKGIKAGLLSQIEPNVDRFFDVYAASVHALGTPVFPKRYFEILKNTFKDDCEILAITKDRQLVSGVMSFYFKDEVLPYYGGGTSLSRCLKGNDFMYWELMRLSCEQGIKIFDYGRSKIGTGSYSFKKNWGFEPEPLHYQYHLVKAQQIPEINPLNPKYKLFIQAWKKMPLGLTRIIGPHIVKNLG